MLTAYFWKARVTPPAVIVLLVVDVSVHSKLVIVGVPVYLYCVVSADLVAVTLHLNCKVPSAPV